MKHRPAFLTSAALGICSLMLTACVSGNTLPPKPADSQTLLRQIQAEIGDAACDAPQQCQSIAIGAKACGGPEAYLAWSSKRSDAAKLRALVDAQAQARRDENAKSGMQSDCRLITDPGAVCQIDSKADDKAGRCQLRPAGAGGASGI